MNAIDQNTPPDIATLRDSETILIAIHFSIPRDFPIVASHGLDSPLILLLLIAQLDAALAGQRLAKEKVGGHGDACDGMILFETCHREAAIEVLKAQLDASGAALFAPWTTIAWHCQDEGAWRIVKQGFDVTPFESRLTPERAEFRRELSARFVRLCDAARAALRRSTNQ